MGERAFDLEAFYSHVGASPKERNVLRQDLVRGLKDYYDSVYGYDRYGAETIFLVPERMGQPHIFGFAMLRILRDRRLPERIKSAVADMTLDVLAYGEEQGLPHGFFVAVDYLLEHDRISPTDLRYALVASAHEFTPFRGLEKGEIVATFRRLMNTADLPPSERIFWGHSLITRHQDLAGATELINVLMSSSAFPVEDRKELCRAWVNLRQPHLVVELPEAGAGYREAFIAEHLPFWIAHAPSWSTLSMIRLGLIWLARLGDDPLDLAETYIDYRGSFAEQIHGAVGDILAEHHAELPPEPVRAIIEKGASAGAIPTRRKFYRLGAELFGPSYLERASNDTAGSVRQWALRQLAKTGK